MNRSSLFNTQNNIEHIFIINLGKLESDFSRDIKLIIRIDLDVFKCFSILQNR